MVGIVDQEQGYSNLQVVGTMVAQK